LDHADWQWITTEYQTGVEEGTGSRSSWRVVATDLSCLRIMMMMMMGGGREWSRTPHAKVWLQACSLCTLRHALYFVIIMFLRMYAGHYYCGGSDHMLIELTLSPYHHRHTVYK